MARSLDRSTTDHLLNSNAVVFAAPFTFSGWFYANDVTNNHCIFSIAGSSDANNPYFAMFAQGGTAGDFMRWQARNTSTELAISTNGFSANTWHHIAGVEAAADDRAVFIDGGGKGTDTTSQTPANLDQTCIGARAIFAGIDNGLDGYVAECALYSAALTDAEVGSLALGYSPLLIRPQSLVSYWHLFGNASPETDRVGGFAMTLFNSPTKASHPRVIYPVHQALALPSDGAIFPFSENFSIGSNGDPWRASHWVTGSG